MKLKGSIIATAMMLSVVTGCTGGGESGGANTLTWLTTSGYSPEAPDAGTGQYLTEKVQTFEAEHGMNIQMSLHPTNIDEAWHVC